MRQLPYGLVLLNLLLLACNEKPKSENLSIQEIVLPEQIESLGRNGSLDRIYRWHREVDTVLLGDMNIDGLADTAIITSPIFSHEHPTSGGFEGCRDGSCFTKVWFSFDSAELEVDRSLGFLTFLNVGDLDDDGIKEVAFVPHWFWSCWSSMNVYSLKDSTWELMISGSVYVCSEANFSDRIKKTGYKKFEFTKAVWNDEAGIDTDSVFQIKL